MNRKSLLSPVILALTCLFAGCQTETTTNVKVNANSDATPNTTANVAPTSNFNGNANLTPAAPNTADAAPTAENAAVSAVVGEYYNALKTKNEAALRGTQSANALKELEVQMRDFGEKSLVNYTTDFDAPPSKPFQVRRVTTQGNVAIAEVLNPDTQAVLPVKFVKEGNGWKYAAPSEQKQIVFSGKK